MSDGEKKSPFAATVGIALQSLQLIAIVAGGIWFLVQYRENAFNSQRQESLKYAAKAYEIHLMNDIAMMNKPFLDPEFKQRFIEVLRKSLADKDICPAISFYKAQLIPLYYSTEGEKQLFFNSMNELSVFYSSLAICVNSKVCDLETACNFFFYDAKAFLTRHCTYFDRIEVVNGYSPVQDIKDFLQQCTNIERFQVPTQSYCDDIRNASGKHLEDLYGACGD